MKTLLFLLFAVLCSGAGVRFPSSAVSVSPDMIWTLRCLTKEEEGKVPNSIVLTHRDRRDMATIWPVERGCDVLWSPDSQQFALTDWSGSTSAEIYLVEANTQKITQLEIIDARKYISESELSGHCYYEALKWETPHQLELRIFGHSDENPAHGFAYHLTLDTRTGETKLLKKDDQEPRS